MNEEARSAIAVLVGPDEASPGFTEVRQQMCQGEILHLMQVHNLRIGIIYLTVSGAEITRGAIDFAACLDLNALASPSHNDREDWP